ncbi:hypothetical protein HHI36_007352 [Cryptolaemus montrouzieri]|uniref:Uncharacterized protein n=1 Tax=Cryptolaemus montrouzieri TaxID=559131 RepID=A0ABD2MPE2_9CUCU
MFVNPPSGAPDLIGTGLPYCLKGSFRPRLLSSSPFDLEKHTADLDFLGSLHPIVRLFLRYSCDMDKKIYDFSNPDDIEAVRLLVRGEDEPEETDDLGEESDVDSQDEVEERLENSDTEQSGEEIDEDDEDEHAFYTVKDKKTVWSSKAPKKTRRRPPKNLMTHLPGVKGINAHVFYLGNQLEPKSRRLFLKQLSHELVLPHLQRRSSSTAGIPYNLQLQLKRFAPIAEKRNHTVSFGSQKTQVCHLHNRDRSETADKLRMSKMPKSHLYES